MARPTRFPTWATDVGTRVEPSAGQKAVGWVPGTKPPARWMNDSLGLIGDWVEYLSGMVSSIGVSNWTERISPKDISLYSVARSEPTKLFVAVGEEDGASDAYIITSSDGISWTEQANPKNFPLQCVAYSDTLNLFVAVGNADGTDAYIVTSPDGTTWTERANPISTQLNGVAYADSLGVLVAVGNDSTITSYDGAVWVARSNVASVSALNHVAWSAFLGLFVAVGDSSGTDALISTSLATPMT